jgi:hypothetical protein
VIRPAHRVRITRMRRILGTITATLAIVAISGVLLGTPKNIPLGDGVDQAYTSEPQEPPTMTLQQALELTSAVLQVPEGEVTRDGRSVSGTPVRTAMAQESNTGEQSEFFVHRINPPLHIPLGDGVDQATSVVYG